MHIPIAHVNQSLLFYSTIPQLHKFRYVILLSLPSSRGMRDQRCFRRSGAALFGIEIYYIEVSAMLKSLADADIISFGPNPTSSHQAHRLRLSFTTLQQVFS
ncbi:hypothetical protein FRC03_007021 [Tulasnella sp. 419]|nr:hypothetical protein FRC03_007021 [Tulasnella sp. 419]